MLLYKISENSSRKFVWLQIHIEFQLPLYEILQRLSHFSFQVLNIFELSWGYILFLLNIQQEIIQLFTVIDLH